MLTCVCADVVVMNAILVVFVLRRVLREAFRHGFRVIMRIWVVQLSLAGAGAVAVAVLLVAARPDTTADDATWDSAKSKHSVSDLRYRPLLAHCTAASSRSTCNSRIGRQCSMRSEFTGSIVVLTAFFQLPAR